MHYCDGFCSIGPEFNRGIDMEQDLMYSVQYTVETVGDLKATFYVNRNGRRFGKAFNCFAGALQAAKTYKLGLDDTY